MKLRQGNKTSHTGGLCLSGDLRDGKVQTHGDQREEPTPGRDKLAVLKEEEVAGEAAAWRERRAG